MTISTARGVAAASYATAKTHASLANLFKPLDSAHSFGREWSRGVEGGNDKVWVRRRLPCDEATSILVRFPQGVGERGRIGTFDQNYRYAARRPRIYVCAPHYPQRLGF